MDTLPILPNPDHHDAFVILWRDRDELLEDIWAVCCPGCHYGPIEMYGVLSLAQAFAQEHRRERAGADLMIKLEQDRILREQGHRGSI